MYRIVRQFHFSASHIIEGLPDSHKCSRLHGHNYVAELVLESDTLDQYGFVVDYNDLQPFAQLIDQKLDHRHLNDVLLGATSAEAIAKWLYDQAKARWQQTVMVRVSETGKTWAQYTQ